MLEMQKFLSNNSLDELEKKYKIEYRICGDKIQFNYNQVDSPMHEKIVQECRGLILRKGSWEIVSYPFDKFFNYEEGNAAKIDWSTAVYQEKLDGSFIQLYFDTNKNKWFFGTRKVSEADTNVGKNSITFAELAQMCLNNMGIKNDFYDKLNKDYTYMFELTSPFNRVCVEHKDLKLTMIGVRNKITLEEYKPAKFAQELGFPIPNEYSFQKLNDISKIMNEINKWSPKEHEGLVVVDSAFSRVKIKTIPYKALHGTVSSIGASDRNLIKLIVLEKLDDIQDMLVGSLKYKALEYQRRFGKLVDKIKYVYNLIKDIDDMKEFAAQAKQAQYADVLFALKRNKTNSVMEYYQENVEKSASGADKILKLIGVENGYPLDFVSEDIKEFIGAYEPNEETFVTLATRFPDVCISLIRTNTLKEIELVWVLEALGCQTTANENVENVLIEFANKDIPFVREGAIYGIDNYLINHKSEKLVSFVKEKIKTSKVFQDIFSDDYKDIK